MYSEDIKCYAFVFGNMYSFICNREIKIKL